MVAPLSKDFLFFFPILPKKTISFRIIFRNCQISAKFRQIAHLSEEELLFAALKGRHDSIGRRSGQDDTSLV